MKVTAADLRVRETRFWPHMAMDFYLERAAMLEVDAKYSTSKAEEWARLMTIRWFERTYPEGLET